MTIANGAPSPRTVLVGMITKLMPHFKMALPKNTIDPDRFVRVALTAISKQPKLLECTQVSVVGALIQSAQLGLMPDGILGEAHLVPFYNSRLKSFECQFIIGYKGYIKLGYRSERVSTIEARVVYEKDDFDFKHGTNKFLMHRPTIDPDRGKLKFTYALICLKDGGSLFEVLSLPDIMEAMAHSKSRDKNGELVGPWIQHEAAMWRKTACRRIAPLAPLDTDWQRAAAMDDLADEGLQNNQAAVLDLDLPDEDFVSNLKQSALAEIEIKQQTSVEELNDQAKQKAEKATQQAFDLGKK